MRRMPLRAALLLAVIVAISVDEGAAQQSSRGQDVDAMTATIHGKVTTAGTGAPVQGAEVRLAATGGARRLVTTDIDGRFTLRDLPAGTYRLDVSRAGFASLQFGQRRPFETPKQIELDEGQSFTADMMLPRSGAVYGHVTDAFGEPLAGTRVQAYRLRRGAGQRRIQLMGPGDQTDDTGYFRVYGLPPGDYYVAASAGAVDSVKRDPPIFFPGTANVADAQIITIASGGEATADFQLGLVRNAQVSGVVLNSAGVPTAAMVSLSSDIMDSGPRLEAPTPTPAFLLTADAGPNGEFTIDKVPPGPYTMTATQRRVPPGAPGGVPMADFMANVPETVSTPVVITGEDVSGISLVTVRPSTLKGEIVAAPGVTSPLPRNVRVSSRAVHFGGVSGMRTEGAGQFTLLGMSGPFYLDVQGLPEGWMVASISVDGNDVTDEPIDLNGLDASARLELTDRTASVAGTVRGSVEAAGYSVILFPDDRARWTSPSRYVRVTRADENGTFQIRGLPAHDRYHLVAVDDFEDGDEQNPDLLDDLRGRTASFSLREGEQRSLVLEAVTR